jgi:hypothetical protein
MISTGKSYSQIGTSSKITSYKYIGTTIIIKPETVHVLIFLVYCVNWYPTKKMHIFQVFIITQTF